VEKTPAGENSVNILMSSPAGLLPSPRINDSRDFIDHMLSHSCGPCLIGLMGSRGQSICIDHIRTVSLRFAHQRGASCACSQSQTPLKSSQWRLVAYAQAWAASPIRRPRLLENSRATEPRQNRTWTTAPETTGGKDIPLEDISLGRGVVQL
jgi:hypothetical protein